MMAEISVLWALLGIVVLFLTVYEYRIPRRVFGPVCALAMAAVLAFNGWLLLSHGVAYLSQRAWLTFSLPRLVFFLPLARGRDARFLFTFCLMDTSCLWLLLVTGLLDHAVGSPGLVILISRLVLYPALVWVAWRWVRRPYRDMLHTVGRGWVLFALLSVLFYGTLSLVFFWPTMIFQRPQDMPMALLLLAMMPLTYVTIFWVLRQQMDSARAQERQRVLLAQAAMLERRAQEVRRSEQQLHIERHDLRHRLQAIASLLQSEGVEAGLAYIGAAQSKLEESRPRRYCTNAMLDTILSSYFAQAQAQDIRVETSLAIPQELPVDAAELSTVFANALENAIHACAQLPVEQRRIICKCVAGPQLMLEVANPYQGEVIFDRDGLPQSGRADHGIGVQSMVAFAEKHGAICRFRAQDGWFRVRVAL